MYCSIWKHVRRNDPAHPWCADDPANLRPTAWNSRSGLDYFSDQCLVEQFRDCSLSAVGSLKMDSLYAVDFHSNQDRDALCDVDCAIAVCRSWPVGCPKFDWTIGCGAFSTQATLLAVRRVGKIHSVQLYPRRTFETLSN
ncbi:hypothetical protein Tsp_01680 [Trichinella spiralis]|uniref:hypothetical protein n=1 Tax=Trichinella spiralis TaxID=6334 RepID=UPI0001EFC696|nr:hypothetical protein Tsp_01680 [Trichinella spiralis]